jgi:hypothetical protein
VLVGLDLDRRPALMRADDLLVGGEGLAMPTICDMLYGTLRVDEKGWCATVYAAYSPHFGTRLVVLDFDVVGMSGDLFRVIGNRLHELAQECRPRCGLMLLVPEAGIPGGGGGDRRAGASAAAGPAGGGARSGPGRGSAYGGGDPKIRVFMMSQSLSSDLVTVTKSEPKKTRVIPSTPNRAVANGERRASLASVKSAVPFSITGQPGRNFSLAG